MEKVRTYLYGVATGFCLLAAMTSCAKAAPGWKYTGGWVCKDGRVSVTHSNDGLGAVNFFIAGAWFDNNSTLRGNALYYNGELCRPFGRPFMDNFRTATPTLEEQREQLMRREQAEHERVLKKCLDRIEKECE